MARPSSRQLTVVPAAPAPEPSEFIVMVHTPRDRPGVFTRAPTGPHSTLEDATQAAEAYCLSTSADEFQVWELRLTSRKTTTFVSR